MPKASAEALEVGTMPSRNEPETITRHAGHMRNSTTTRFGRRQPQGDGYRKGAESVCAERQGRREDPVPRPRPSAPLAARVVILATVVFGTTIGVGLWWPSIRSLATAVAARQDCTIKGNLSEHGDIYHMPGDEHYLETRIDTSRGERWFCTEAEARTAGWRRAMR